MPRGQRRASGRFFREEIARPLGLDFYIGLPPGIPDERIARIRPLSPLRGLLALTKVPPSFIARVIWPKSLMRQSLANPAVGDFTDRRSLEVEVPAGNGVGPARAIARAYSAFAQGGAELGVTRETMHHITAEPARVDRSGSPIPMCGSALRT